ncbi:MAG: 3-dehydroquinate synthase [Planctomycetes bacterium]|nr:3-dehydroquinate synthase [Planctomycetota bacterium]MBI3835598.1 3-dehydroquinate synthase [Planctomycetota bacterium]
MRNIFLAPLADIGAKCREAGCRRIVLVSDRMVIGHYGAAVMQTLAASGFDLDEFIIECGERSKSLESAEALYRFLAGHHVERDALILALGGGVVSDLAGFVAATWMRGIRWAICPTTLEAQIDAAIGGKTAINIPGGKNLVGAFHEPTFVLIDPATLATLPDRDFRSGLAESVKHALITSEEFFAWHESHCEAILSRNSSVLDELIHRNVQTKSDIVASDPRETTGARMVLNFGHTIGHAIEECSDFSLRHGECVALGMIAACRLSTVLGLTDAQLADRVTALLQKLGLPTVLTTAIPENQIISAVRKDKKNRSVGLRFVLLEGIGRTIVPEDVAESKIIETYKNLAD